MGGTDSKWGETTSTISFFYGNSATSTNSKWYNETKTVHHEITFEEVGSIKLGRAASIDDLLKYIQ